jgi:hypothetical protein
MDIELKKMKKEDLLKIIGKMKKNDLVNIILSKAGGDGLQNSKNAIRQYIVYDEKKIKNNKHNYNVMANDNIYENVE